jgi:hypothetical protein
MSLFLFVYLDFIRVSSQNITNRFPVSSRVVSCDVIDMHAVGGVLTFNSCFLWAKKYLNHVTTRLGK